MSDAASRLPNLYQLLGLTALESDRGKIAAAIKRVQQADGKPTAAASEELERNQKIVALAQKYLLDPQRKLAYDQQWKTVYQASPSAAEPAAAPVKAAVSAAPTKTPASAATAVTTAAVATASPATPSVAPAPSAENWDYSRLDQLLPQGDPQAAFDMASFLRSGGESRDPLAAQADLDKLIALLSSAAGSGGDASGAFAIGIEHRHDYEESSGSGLGLPPSARGGQSVAPSGSLARRMRQRKRRALIAGGTALAAGLGGLLLLGVYLFGPKSELAGTQLAQAEQQRPAPARSSGLPKVGLANVPAASDVARNALQSTPSVGSGLPKPGEGAMNLEVDTSATAPQTPAAMPASMPESKPEAMSEAMPKPAPEPSAAPAPASGTPTTTPTTPTPTTTPTPESEPKPGAVPKPEGEPTPGGESKPASEPEPQPAPAAEPELASEEKRAWQKGMTKAKELIGKQDFEAAEKQLTELKTAAKTSQQRGQLERLEQVLGFVKDVRQAMVDAIAGLGPAETFKAGPSAIASFVEGNDQRITVRVSGQRRSFSLEDMPVMLGLGLADLKMDVENANSLARKGAYILTHPRGGKAAVDQGKQMLQEAAAAGAISPEMATFYQDDFSLSKDAN